MKFYLRQIEPSPVSEFERRFYSSPQLLLSPCHRSQISSIVSWHLTQDVITAISCFAQAKPFHSNMLQENTRQSGSNSIHVSPFLSKRADPSSANGFRIPIIASCNEDIFFCRAFIFEENRRVFSAWTLSAPLNQYTGDCPSWIEQLSFKALPALTNRKPPTMCPFSIRKRRHLAQQVINAMWIASVRRALIFNVVAIVVAEIL